VVIICEVICLYSSIENCLQEVGEPMVSNIAQFHEKLHACNEVV